MQIAESKARIEALNNQIETAVRSRELEMAADLARRDAEIARLKGELANTDDRRRMALFEERQKASEEIRKKENEIARITNEVATVRSEAMLREASMRERHEAIIREKDAAIELYRDMKARMSTKMIGESLEIHCANEFNRIRATAYPQAFFDKDNDASSGS